MKDGWKYEKFSDVFDLQMGKTPSRDNPRYWNGVWVWVSIADLKEKYIRTTKESITDIAVKETGICKIPKGTVIMSFKLTVGRAAITDCDLYTNEAIMAFLPKQIDVVIPDFVYYYLKGYRWVGSNKAVMGLTLNKKSISENIFSYPSLSTQKQIVSELDKLSGIIEKKKRQVKELDTLAQSIFYDMFGDPVENEKGWNIATFDGIMKPAKTERCGDRIGLPILSITMHNGIIMQSDRFKKVIASRNTKDYKVVRDGQLVIAFPIDEGLIFTQDVAAEGIMSPAYNIWDVDYNLVHRTFINYYFHSSFSMRYYKDKLRGTTQRRRMIPKEDLLGMPIFLPPLPLQQSFAKKVEAIEKQKEIINQSIQEVQTLFDSRMEYYFGE